MASTSTPTSVVDGIVWPAIPSPETATTLAIIQQLEQSQWWPPEILERHQLQQLEFLVTHAWRTVPIYRERLQCLDGLRRGQLTMDLFRQIPILKRGEISEMGEDILSRQLPEDHFPTATISTSGSTRAPMTIKTTAVTRQIYKALNLRFHLWHQRDFSAKICWIKVLKNDPDDIAGRWAPGYESGPVLEFEISKPVSQQLAWLREHNPDYLFTYPTNLRELIKLSEASGDGISNLKQVGTMAGVMDDDIRTECERVWQVPVIDGYSSQEVGFIALQCPSEPIYHVQSESLLVEILDDADRPCAPGEIGRVVITDLQNFAMPLIRYEIGDYAELGESCPCGRGLPVLKRIMGRTRNMLRLPSGDSLWPRFAAGSLSKLPYIRQVQLVQTSFEEIVINLVVTHELTPEEEKTILDLVSTSIGHSFEFKFNYMAEIKRSASGKFEDFMSELAG